jgi:membrane fusion protein, copper/silver efflux system
MNKLTKLLQKEYLKGLSVMAAILVLGVWAVQHDWSSIAMFNTKDNGVANADFINAGPFQLAVSIQPETPQVGKNHVLIQVRDNQGQPIQGAKVRAVGEMPAMGAMPAMYAQADITEISPGVYKGDFELNMAGAWPLAIDVATDEAHHVDLSFDMATGRKGITLTTATPSGDVAYHTCSMHPSVKSATPGTCPICGMDLVPVTKAQQQSGSILVDEGRRQTIGVKTGIVEKDHFEVQIRLQGEITYDQTRLTDISLRYDGWIGELKADFKGKTIQQGDVLFTVYSPELLSLQQEYLETIKRNGTGRQRRALTDASRKRLILWGLNHEQITWLERQGKPQDYVPIFAPSDGVVIEKHIVNGSAFKRGERLLRLADLSNLWIEAFAYEQDLPLIEPGMKASVRFPNIANSLNATLMQIDPFLGNHSRTAKVRLQVANTDGHLKPGLFTTVTLRADFGEMLLIPEDAVLVSGEKRIVFRDLGAGRLKPQTIRTGYSDGQRVVVREGLSAGDAIVISGNFLIAAESKLKSGVDQW